jgi:DMSO/TMAO reductase YedYZ molybdopterin-dependent catalytic subunit
MAEAAGEVTGKDRRAQMTVTMDPPRTFRRVPLLPHQLLSKITAQRDLFVLAHVGVPRIDPATWTLSITGLVREPVTFSFDRIRQMPKKQVEAFHQCAGYPSNPKIATRRVGNVVWGGVDLKTLLDELGVLPEARFLWSYGLDSGEYEGVRSDAYLKDCPLDRLERGDVLLAYEINGEPLDAEHGFPLRLLVPGFYGTNSVKWLSRLHLADRRAEGPFTTQLYNDAVEGGTRPVWQIAPESVIVNPAPAAQVGGQAVEIWGWAWADGGVAAVEISTDGGKSWAPAALDRPNGRSWQKFRMFWQAEGAGEAVLMSRATGTQGAVQPLADWRNCVHAVHVSRTGGA